MQSLTRFLEENDRLLKAQERLHTAEKLSWLEGKPVPKAKRTPAKRAAEARYRGKNLARTNAWKAHRRALKMKATPSWADRKAIEAVYEEANRRGLTVDHIYPLRGTNSCGLHVSWNLQLLTRSENSAKGNRVGFPCEAAPLAAKLCGI